tara:strand:- start:555 stop:809 length:255 start_codon:yes stop_codon:yes gene_type:complete
MAFPLQSLTGPPSLIGNGAYKLDWQFEAEIHETEKYRMRKTHTPEILLRGLSQVSSRSLRQDDAAAAASMEQQRKLVHEKPASA